MCFRSTSAMSNIEKIKSLATEIIEEIQILKMDNVALESLVSGETSGREMAKRVVVKQGEMILSLQTKAIELKNLCSEDDDKQAETTEGETEFPKLQRSNHVVDPDLLK